MFVRDFSLFSGMKEKPERVASDRNARPLGRPSAGAGIAILLLAFIAGEALTTVHAFRYEVPVAALAPGSPATLNGLLPIPTAMPENRNVQGKLGRAGQATAPAIRSRSESETGGKLKSPVRSASSVFPPAN